uniref:Large S protein n=1 Tax=Hepatitis B virus TaxID=10407 RepID=D2X416_HBV|nr:large S protein [Hepatitis B virus]
MGGPSSKPRRGMGTNLAVPNPLGFFPDHQLDLAFRANSNNPDWDFNPNKDHWPEANQVGAGAFGPFYKPSEGGILYKRETTRSASFCGSPYSWEQELQGSQEDSLLPSLHL